MYGSTLPSFASYTVLNFVCLLLILSAVEAPECRCTTSLGFPSAVSASISGATGLSELSLESRSSQ